MTLADDLPLDTPRLRALALSGAGEAIASPLHASPYLLLDLDKVDGADADADVLIAWLKNQPCPVIGIHCGLIAPAWRDACDLVADRQDNLDILKRNIRQAPLAAMTLVQVLRVTETLPLAQALTVESLAYATLQAGPEFAAWSQAHPPSVHRAAQEDGPAVLIQRQGDGMDLILNRPATRNAMSVEMRDAIAEALQLVVSDSSIEHIRFSGAGACFSVGGELREFGSLPDPVSAHAVRSIRLPSALLIRCAERVQFHVHGACIGAGIELPAFGSRVVADAHTFFQLPEIRFGLLPGAGGCVSIPRRIGRHRTAWLALSARRINADTALEWGLVDAIAV